MASKAPSASKLQEYTVEPRLVPNEITSFVRAAAMAVEFYLFLGLSQTEGCHSHNDLFHLAYKFISRVESTLDSVDEIVTGL